MVLLCRYECDGAEELQFMHTFQLPQKPSEWNWYVSEDYLYLESTQSSIPKPLYLRCTFNMYVKCSSFMFCDGYSHVNMHSVASLVPQSFSHGNSRRHLLKPSPSFHLLASSLIRLIQVLCQGQVQHSSSKLANFLLNYSCQEGSKLLVHPETKALLAFLPALSHYFDQFGIPLPISPLIPCCFLQTLAAILCMLSWQSAH